MNSKIQYLKKSITKSVFIIRFVIIILFFIPLSAQARPLNITLSHGQVNGSILSSNSNILFQDNFDDGNADGWTTSGVGVWYVENGEYIIDMGSGLNKGGTSFAGDINWCDYSMFVDVKGDLGVDTGIMFRAITDSDFYFINIRSNPENDIQLGKDTTVLTSVSYPNTNGVWLHAKVVCEGANIKVYVNSQLLIDYTASGSNLITHGRIGLAGWTGAWGSDKVRYDNVLVSSIINAGFRPNLDEYQFPNNRGHTSWEIFRDTYGAENVEWTILGKTCMV